MSLRLTTEQFISKAQSVHGNRYDYSKVCYAHAHEPVEIICREHGPFKQKPNAHLNGRGCPVCGRAIVNQSKSMSQDEFIAKLRDRYQDAFDFSQAVYTSMKVKTTIICPAHGPFQATPNFLLHPKTTHGCPACAREKAAPKIAATKRKSLDALILEARQVHGDRYDYSQAFYKGAFASMTILCPEHGPFLQAPRVHLSGSGCPQCAMKVKKAESRLNETEFLARAKEKHGEQFDYSNTVYEGYESRIPVRCKKHNCEFTVKAASHLVGKGGCPECANENRARITESVFLERANALYKNRFQYENYTGINDEVTLICPEHGAIQQVAYVHLRGGGCPVCSRQVYFTGSKEENNVLDFIKTMDPAAYRGDKELIYPQELDIISHSRTVAIEYCGLYWHSDFSNTKGAKAKTRHLDKLNKVEASGYRLITIFADEWIAKNEISKSLLARIFGIASVTKVGARDCLLQKIASEIAKAFCDRFHLQGASNASLHLGLFYRSQLIAVASIGTRAIYGSSEEGTYELIRFCQHPGYSVIGGLAKLTSRIPEFLPIKKLFSFVDRRWFTGASYLSAGFSLVGTTEPGYWWVRGLVRASRFQFAKHRLEKKLESFDPSLSEVENMKANGWNRIYDCGQLRFEKQY